MILRILLVLAVAVFFSGISPPVSAGPLDETRYCGEPKRDAHVVSLGAKHPTLGGGCDTVSNMQWLPVQIKTCAGLYCKDRWELWVYSIIGGAP